MHETSNFAALKGWNEISTASIDTLSSILLEKVVKRSDNTKMFASNWYSVGKLNSLEYSIIEQVAYM